MDEGKDYIILKCSGKKVYAYSRIVGLGIDDGELYYGYDGHLAEFSVRALTIEEKKEIGLLMIGKWQAFLDRLVHKEDD
ncbi:MAG: hypothetical protein GY718_01850 [Lentisphaerae bacterium]|nr:hypothetical protein [Lentisphaerota bacterium]